MTAQRSLGWVLAAVVGLGSVGCSDEPPVAPVVVPPVMDDPINLVDLAFFRKSAEDVMRELVAALPDHERTLMETVPLVTEDEPGFVNAFASCKGGNAKMAISDEMLRIQAFLARARATDELFGTQKFDEYLRFLTENMKPEQAVPHPPQTFFDATQDTEARKVARQHELFAEELAFVMGHEIAHHYLGHTGCVGTPHPLVQIGNLLSGRVPIFNQPFELAADTHGTQNLLNAGARHSGYKWTEGGATMTLTFFASFEQQSGGDLLFAFIMSHPPANVRMPVVTQAANNWRAAQPRPPMPTPQ